MLQQVKKINMEFYVPGIKCPRNLTLCTTLDATYYPLCSYLCILTAGCLVNPNPSTKPIACTSLIFSVKESFILTAECYEHILHLQMKIDFTEPITIPPEHPEEKKKERSKRWVKCGQITLYQNERNVLTSGKWLSDLHTSAAQELLKKQFPKFGGFQSTLLQLKEPIKIFMTASTLFI